MKGQHLVGISDSLFHKLASVTISRTRRDNFTTERRSLLNLFFVLCCQKRGCLRESSALMSHHLEADKEWGKARL